MQYPMFFNKCFYVTLIHWIDKMEALLSIVFSKGHSEFREKCLRQMSQICLSCCFKFFTYIKVKAFCGEVYCFTGTLK